MRVSDVERICQSKNPEWNSAFISEVIMFDSKFRFQHNENRDYIRAVQGWGKHIAIDKKLVLSPWRGEQEWVYHGTSNQGAQAILAQGLKPMGRNTSHMALRPNSESGLRWNSEVIIKIHVPQALALGLEFWISTNGVVLCAEDIPPCCLSTHTSKVR